MEPVAGLDALRRSGATQLLPVAFFDRAFPPQSVPEGFVTVPAGTTLAAVWAPRGWTMYARMQQSGVIVTHVIRYTTDSVVTQTDVRLTTLGIPRRLESALDVRMLSPVDDSQTVLVCSGMGTPFFMGPAIITEWQHGGPGCDRFMEGRCASGSAHRQSPECNCFTDQEALEIQFGTNKYVPPAVCYGAKCPNEGYRTARMKAQQCSIKVCEAVSSGVARADQTVYCGGRMVVHSSTPEMTPEPAKQGTGLVAGGLSAPTITYNTNVHLPAVDKGEITPLYAGLVTVLFLALVWLAFRVFTTHTRSSQ